MNVGSDAAPFIQGRRVGLIAGNLFLNITKVLFAINRMLQGLLANKMCV